MGTPPKKKRGGLIALIVVLVLALIGGGGGWYAYSNWSIKEMSISFPGGDSSLTMNVGDTLTGTVTTTPAKPLSDSYTYEVSNPAKLTVQQDGATVTITATKPGSVTVTGTSANNGITTTTNVTILQPAKDIQGLPDSITLEESGTLQLTVTVLPDDTTDQLQYSIDDTTVATIDDQGLVTAVAQGTATLSATAGSVTKTVPIKVKPLITWTRGTSLENIPGTDWQSRPYVASQKVVGCTGFSLFYSITESSVTPSQYASELNNTNWLVYAYGPNGWTQVATFEYGEVGSIFTGDITFPAMDITKVALIPGFNPPHLQSWGGLTVISNTQSL